MRGGSAEQETARLQVMTFGVSAPVVINTTGTG